MCGMDLSPAKQVMATTTISGRKYTGREVCSYAPHALHVQNCIKEGHAPTHRNMEPTLNAILIWPQLMTRTPRKLPDPVAFGHFGLVNLPHKGGPGTSRGQVDCNLDVVPKHSNNMLVIALIIIKASVTKLMVSSPLHCQPISIRVHNAPIVGETTNKSLFVGEVGFYPHHLKEPTSPF